MSLADSLRQIIRKISREPYISKELLNEVVRDLQRALLLADVPATLVTKISRSIREKASKEKLPRGIDPRKYLIKIIYEELLNIIGEQGFVDLTQPRPIKILLVGLYGSGKTTTAAKLARYFQKRGLRVALIGCDVHRPAAVDQLIQLAEEIRVPIYATTEKKPLEIVKEGLSKFKDFDIIIVDSTDPVGPGVTLFTEEFYKRCFDALKEDGILITQCESFFFHTKFIAETLEKLRKFFPKVWYYYTQTPTYPSGCYGFSFCSKKYHPVKDVREKKLLEPVKYYNKEHHKAAFMLPTFALDAFYAGCEDQKKELEL